MILTAKQILAVCFLFTTLLSEVSCLRHSYEIKLSGPVDIGDQWVELRGDSPLKAEQDYQWVRLDLEQPLKDDTYNEGRGQNKGKGILMPDGDVINPEIELVDDHGSIYKLLYHGSRFGGPVYGLSNANALPRDRQYNMVRIRSTRPIKCKAVYWFCESSKDWK
jgi:hypothetical protein